MRPVGRKSWGSLKIIQGPWPSLCLLPGHPGKLHQVFHTTLAQSQSSRTKCLWTESSEIISQKMTPFSLQVVLLGHFVTVTENLLTQPEVHVEGQPPSSSVMALWVGHFTRVPYLVLAFAYCIPCSLPSCLYSIPLSLLILPPLSPT